MVNQNKSNVSRELHIVFCEIKFPLPIVRIRDASLHLPDTPGLEIYLNCSFFLHSCSNHQSSTSTQILQLDSHRCFLSHTGLRGKGLWENKKESKTRHRTLSTTSCLLLHSKWFCNDPLSTCGGSVEEVTSGVEMDSSVPGVISVSTENGLVSGLPSSVGVTVASGSTSPAQEAPSVIQHRKRFCVPLYFKFDQFQCEKSYWGSNNRFWHTTCQSEVSS